MFWSPRRSSRVEVSEMRIVVAATLAGALAAGCAVGPNYRRPPIAPPDQFRGQEGAPQQASLADQAWWEILGDASLKALIDEALRNGYDTREAAWRVEEARANAG